MYLYIVHVVAVLIEVQSSACMYTGVEITTPVQIVTMWQREVSPRVATEALSTN